MHKSIRRVTDSISELKYNTAISELMIVLNKFEDDGEVQKKDFETFLLLLAPIAPFITEELWEKLGNKYSIHKSRWPSYDPKKLIDSKIKLIVQINGKLRGTVDAKKGISQKDAEKLALAAVSNYIKGSPKKTVFVKDRLINFVV